MTDECSPAYEPILCDRCGETVCGCYTHQAWCVCWYGTEDFLLFMKEQAET